MVASLYFDYAFSQEDIAMIWEDLEYAKPKTLWIAKALLKCKKYKKLYLIKKARGFQ